MSLSTAITSSHRDNISSWSFYSPTGILIDLFMSAVIAFDTKILGEMPKPLFGTTKNCREVSTTSSLWNCICSSRSDCNISLPAIVRKKVCASLATWKPTTLMHMTFQDIGHGLFLRELRECIIKHSSFTETTPSLNNLISCYSFRYHNFFLFATHSSYVCSTYRKSQFSNRCIFKASK